MSPLKSFERLIHPVKMDYFLETHWNKQALYIPGDPKKLKSLEMQNFSVSAIFDFFGKKASALTNENVLFIYRDGFTRSIKLPGFSADIAHKLYRAGLTLHFFPLEKFFPIFTKLTTELKKELGFPQAVGAAAILSPHGEGSLLHFDHVPVIVLQCEGEKRWKYCRTPDVQYPIDHEGRPNDYNAMLQVAKKYPGESVRVPAEEEMEEKILRPGDMLFLPAGTWHTASGLEHSLAISFTFVVPTVEQLFLRALKRVIPKTLDWRKFPIDGDDIWQDRSAARKWLAAKFDDLKDQLSKIEAHTLIDAARIERRKPPKRQPPKATRSITKSTWLHVEAPRDIGMYIAGGMKGDQLVVGRGTGKAVALPKKYELPLHEAFAAKRFLAGDFSKWFSGKKPLWREIKPMLEFLVEAQVFSRPR